MNKNIKVSEIMSKNVFTVDINDPVNKADVIFKVVKIHNLPVLEDGQICRTYLQKQTGGV
jgi:signal-transduction protein with cAMP-binding, CBS, and nucleotidyltransferase domain